MKKLLTSLYGSELKKLSRYTSKQRAAYIYFLVSLALMFLIACCNSVTLLFFAIANLVVANYLAGKYVPNFKEEEVDE